MGDAIAIQVYEKFDISGGNRLVALFNDQEFIIDSNGEIHLFSLGKLRVAGLTTDEVSFLLIDKFKPYIQDPVVIVKPLIRITLRGAFGAPGMYRFRNDISFWDMAREAGGLGIKDLSKIKLYRNHRELSADFHSAFYRANSLYELGLESGDILEAPAPRRITFEKVMRYSQFCISLLWLYIYVTREGRYRF